MNAIPTLFHTLAEAAQPGFSLGNPMIMIPLMFVVLYFLLIRPQRMQRKELEARINSLETGDRVVTTSGIHGIVHKIHERTLLIKIAESTIVEFDKPAVAVVQKREAAQ